jgi:valyl-tRNA synthetase
VTYAALGPRGAEVKALVGSCDKCDVLPPSTAPPGGCAVSVINATTSVHLHLTGSLDPCAELGRLQKHLEGVQGKIDAVRQRMQMPMYGETPEGVKAKDAGKVVELTAELESVNLAITDMKALAASEKQ